MTAVVRRILLYPIKSLDPVAVREASVLSSGAIAADREYAIVDESGSWVNGKRDPRIHRIRAQYELDERRVVLSVAQDVAQEIAPETFHLERDREKIEVWLSRFFGRTVRLDRNTALGFPDDTDSPGPTVVSRETYESVGAWFGIDPDQASRRFRANIEIAAGAPFWEDSLVSASGEPRDFQVGNVRLHGINPCQRCPVPSRHPDTGVVQEQFQSEFSMRREAELPSWAPLSRFNHFYRLSVNTRIPPSEAGKKVRVGDTAVLL